MDNVSLQDMFDGIVSMTATQAAMVYDMEQAHYKHSATIATKGYTEAVLKDWDEIANKYGLSFTHRKMAATPLASVGGTEHTLH